MDLSSLSNADGIAKAAALKAASHGSKTFSSILDLGTRDASAHRVRVDGTVFIERNAYIAYQGVALLEESSTPSDAATSWKLLDSQAVGGLIDLR
jgi:hypothetical protein